VHIDASDGGPYYEDQGATGAHGDSRRPIPFVVA